MQIAIHAGAAFTDEGRFFKLLQANSRVIGRNEGAFWGFPEYKRIFRPALKSPGPPFPVSDATSQLGQLRADYKTATRWIFTSAEFVGDIPSAIQDGQFYPFAGERIANLTRLFDGGSVELFLALRNPGSFIPRVLSALPASARSAILASTDLSCLSWLPMIEDIRALAPDVNVTLWSNEDSPLIWGDILRCVAGLPQDARLNREYAFLSSLVTDIGKQKIKDVMDEDPARDDPELKRRMARIFRQHAVADAIEEEVDLSGWSDDVVQAFTELYEQDLARLQAMPDIRFLKV